MPRLTGFDIRTKDFARAVFGRGYNRRDVDAYLSDIAATLDEIEAETAAAAAAAPLEPAEVLRDALAENEHMGSSHLVLQQARRMAADTIRDAEARADQIIADAQASVRELHLKVREARDQALAEAREIVAEAREREEQASRREAEVELRRAHAEQLLQDRAESLRLEATRLDALAGEVAGGAGGEDSPDGSVLPLRKAD